MTRTEYKRISAAVLFLAIAGLTLPLFLPLLNKMPGAGACPSLIILGKPCPLCGLTRGFNSIWHMHLAEAAELNILSVPLFLFTMLQAGFRGFVVARIDKHPKLLAIARLDGRLHAWLAGIYLLYVVVFAVVGLAR